MRGSLSVWLVKHALVHRSLGFDYQGIETLQIKPEDWYLTNLNLKRISRPGLRIYSNYEKIPRILGGMGIVILSTSRGIMTDREARLERVGGELLCYIW